MRIKRPLPNAYRVLVWLKKNVPEGAQVVVQSIDGGYDPAYHQAWILNKSDNLSDRRTFWRRLWDYPDPHYADRSWLLICPYPGYRIVESLRPEHDDMAIVLAKRLEVFCGEEVTVHLASEYKESK